MLLTRVQKYKILTPACAGRVLAGSFDGSVIVWDVETRNLIVKLGVEIEGSGGWRVEKIRDRHEDAVTACAFMPVDGSERAVTRCASFTCFTSTGCA